MEWMWMWFGVSIVLFIVELCTIDLVSVWFALSALLLGIITAFFPDMYIAWQLAIFVVVSAGLFLATRPLVKRFLKRKKGQETNLELVIGATTRVTERIENDRECGAVKVNGLTWTARSVDDSVIDEDSLVVVKEIKGNKLFVEKSNIE